MENNSRPSRSLSWWRILSIIVVYFVGYIYLSSNLLNFIYYDLFKESIDGGLAYFLTYLIFLVTVVSIAWPVLEESYQSLRNSKDFFKHLIILFAEMFLVMFVINLVMSLFSLGESANQQSVGSFASVYPNVFLFSSLIFAPIVEETIFRGIFYRQILSFANKNIAIVVSMVSFGMIHIWNAVQSQQFSELVFLPLYGFMGYFFVKAYERTDSLFGAICLHLMWNSLAAVSLLLFKLI